MRLRRAPPPEKCPLCSEKLCHGPYCFWHMHDWVRSFARRWWARYGFFSDDFHDAMVRVHTATMQKKLDVGSDAFLERDRKVPAWVVMTERGRCAVQWEVQAAFKKTGIAHTACGFLVMLGDKPLETVLPVEPDGPQYKPTVSKDVTMCVLCQSAWVWKESGMGPWPFQQKDFWPKEV